MQITRYINSSAGQAGIETLWSSLLPDRRCKLNEQKAPFLTQKNRSFSEYKIPKPAVLFILVLLFRTPVLLL